jgi:hypothetical protein
MKQRRDLNFDHHRRRGADKGAQKWDRSLHVVVAKGANELSFHPITTIHTSFSISYSQKCTTKAKNVFSTIYRDTYCLRVAS